MDVATGLLGSLGEPEKVIKACTEVSIFVLDTFLWRSDLSRLRVTITPEAASDVDSIDVYKVMRSTSSSQRYRLMYNCRHTNEITAATCSHCDLGSIRNVSPPLDSVMYSNEVLDAMSWLSQELNALGARGVVQVGDGVVKEIDWWRNNPEEEEPRGVVESPFSKADIYPTRWCDYLKDKYGIDVTGSAVHPFQDAPPDQDTPSDQSEEDVPMGNTASTPSQSSKRDTSREDTPRPQEQSNQSEAQGSPRPIYWDPVNDSRLNSEADSL